MKDYRQRMWDIIEIIRKRDNWVNNHSSMTFGDNRIDYYDAGQGDSYFTLKHDDVYITHNCSAIVIDYQSMEAYNKFNMDTWLSELEDIVKNEELIINGVKYIIVKKEV